MEARKGGGQEGAGPGAHVTHGRIVRATAG